MLSQTEGVLFSLYLYSPSWSIFLFDDFILGQYCIYQRVLVGVLELPQGFKGYHSPSPRSSALWNSNPSHHLWEGR